MFYCCRGLEIGIKGVKIQQVLNKWSLILKIGIQRRFPKQKQKKEALILGLWL